ncbi:MAG: ATP-binding protein [Armatimonadetes bacterium]|nr:ATP-binding protein [Armatimonadota bacterium]
MITSLRLTNVGPAPAMEMEFAPRLNLLTGDNGLGKSFLLDVAWWALTRRWPRDVNPRLTASYPARPTNPRQPATICFGLRGRSRDVTYKATYVARDEAWVGRAGRPATPSLVVYAQSDGGFAVWDPARNYWRTKGQVDVQERQPAYVFSPSDVWNGLFSDQNGASSSLCNGLIRDWSVWIREQGDLARMMAEAVACVAPPDEALRPGPLVRLSVGDVRDIPSIRTAYADAVPVVHASAGVRRAISLAYMLIWSWTEHTIAAAQLGEEPCSRLVMLFDEIEAHLHPRWQRSVLQSLISVVARLSPAAAVQLVAATHSPLVLASAEPWFDPSQDAWFDLDLDLPARSVALTRRPFQRQGTAGRWLTSPAFDLPSEGRSVEAEAAIAKAVALADRRRATGAWDAADVSTATAALAATLPPIDHFWVRWLAETDADGVAA